jgi:predicted metal-dependent enzyme (double-stranded beta helix superfamily)
MHAAGAGPHKGDTTIPYTLPDLADDIRSLLSKSPASECAPALCAAVSKALTDKDFIAKHLPDRAPGAHPREVLFEDPELGFCICGHVYGAAANSEPHDHGTSWAIYGQAVGTTEMTDWEIVEPGEADRPARVEPRNVYEMRPGDAHFYGVGAVHSPRRAGPTRLIRIEGANLDKVQRSNIAAAA